MGFLDGDIQELFGSVFSGIYLDGQLMRTSAVDDGQGGGSETPAAPIGIKVQIDACTEQMRQQSGYTDKDVRLLILQAGVTGGDIDTDCLVSARGGDYDVAWVTQDPAASYWECRATRR